MVYAKRGPAVRIVYLLVSCFWYILTGFGRRFAGRRLVLCYHGIPGRHASRFRDQMMHLSRSGVSDRTGNGIDRSHLPAVCVTFDDGYENLMQNALPVLDELGIPAVIFAVPGNLGQTPQWRISPDHPDHGERLMTAEQLRQLARRSDIVIGSHTQTHPVLSELPSEQVRRELAESKRNLEEVIGRPVTDLAFPHGAFNDAVLDTAREVGYARMYTLEPRMLRPQQGEDVIGRFSMSPDVWPIEFHLTCAGAYAWLYGWRRFIRTIRRSPVH